MLLSPDLGVVLGDGHCCASPLQIFQHCDLEPSSLRPDYVGQKTFQRREHAIGEKAQNVGRFPAPPTGDLDAGQKGHAVYGRESSAFCNAIDVVVLGEGQGRQSLHLGQAEDLLRSKRYVVAARRTSMDVQICFSHQVYLLSCPAVILLELC